MTTPTILVTGATGTVGQHVVQQLAQQQARVLAGVRDPAQADLPPGVQAVKLNFHDPSTHGALAGVDRLFLLWPPGTNHRADVLPLIDAARRQGVRQVVFLSILGAQRLPFLPHRQIEQHLQASGLDWVFLRASYFMQNLSGVHRDDLRQRDEIFLPAGHGRTSFVDARDVAAVAVQALLDGRAGCAYDLTGEVALSYFEAAEVFSVTLGRRITYTNPSPLRFVRTTVARGTRLSFALFMLAEYTVARLGLAGRVTDTVRGVLGRPATSLRQFAEAYRETWLRGAGG